MNKIILKKSMRNIINHDRLEYETRVCKSLKYNILNVLKDYYFVDENNSEVSIMILKNGEIKFNFSCIIKDWKYSDILQNYCIYIE